MEGGAGRRRESPHWTGGRRGSRGGGAPGGGGSLRQRRQNQACAGRVPQWAGETAGAAQWSEAGPAGVGGVSAAAEGVLRSPAGHLGPVLVGGGLKRSVPAAAVALAESARWATPKGRKWPGLSWRR